ncbi:hypothetical protein [Micromonospora carbonacea]|uniref:Uncharacterized protein n=1 Tax=Micromonospora carbonacea TaxID=47853 RepID=A0A1C4X0K9_9ACTN|nr:hypothetical protein [Micromonospora carbonacea]SCF02037.1 hypothetical protein GA0070563_104151 [Micromonospora carbonacea]
MILTALAARLTEAANQTGTDPASRARVLLELQSELADALTATINEAVAAAAADIGRLETAEAIGRSPAEVGRRITAHNRRVGKPGRPGRRRRQTA